MSRAKPLVSRDCTVEDLALVMPGATVAEREAFLAGHHERGDVVTFAVADVDGPLAGMIIGPPGSEGFLRRPGDEARPVEPPEQRACRGRTDEETAVLGRG